MILIVEKSFRFLHHGEVCCRKALAADCAAKCDVASYPSFHLSLVLALHLHSKRPSVKERSRSKTRRLLLRRHMSMLMAMRHQLSLLTQQV